MMGIYVQADKKHNHVKWVCHALFGNSQFTSQVANFSGIISYIWVYHLYSYEYEREYVQTSNKRVYTRWYLNSSLLKMAQSQVREFSYE